VNHTNRRTLQLLTLSPLALALAMSASAATRSELHDQNISLLNSQYKLAAAHLGAAAKPADRHAEMLGLDSESRLNVLTHNQDADGTNHYRYEQTFRGVPIWGEQVIVSESKDGSIKHLFGRSFGGLGADLPNGQALIGKARATSIGRAAGLGNRAASLQVSRENVRQMIFIDDNGRAHQAYVVELFADSATGTATRPFIIVDGTSGKVLKQWEGLTHATIGTGPGGNVKTGQYEWGSGGTHGYMDVSQSGTTCTMNNANVKGVNLGGGTTSTTAFTYTCPRNTFQTINGGYSPINDAFQFGGFITGMYPAYTGYNALTIQLVMRVHYKTSYENAFWDGSTMSFGDGASTFYPLVSADVAGHEVSHGFTEQHSNLTYSGQSGGMNEAFSDMGGEATEYFWKGSNDFLVGEEIFKGASGQALRYMANPPQDGGSIDNAANYTSSMDVHYTSGVYNKAFWKLATTSGWNTPTAFKVFARANALYWTASSTYNSGACGVETAATDLGLTKADVTAAFSLVGVSCSGGGGGGGTVALTNGVAQTGLSGATGAYDKFTLVVPAGATGLKFVMSGGTGDADMYVKFGSAPTDTVYDCRPYVSGNAETCTIATAQAGTYYVNLKGYSAFSGVSLTGSYTAGGTNTAPTANWSATTSGLVATFTDSSTDAQNNITGHSWNFGDGSTSTTTSPSHTYAASGTYSVSETVTDAGGLTSTKTASVTVSGGGSCGGTVLCSGVGVALPSVATGGVSGNYTMAIAAGHTATFTISGGTGDADLYVKAGSAPTTSSYTCRPYTTGNSETCTVTPSTATTYYVNVRAYAGYSGVTLKGTTN
jgi:Zn-dependent metalloprotease/PKD repeat protein